MRLCGRMRDAECASKFLGGAQGALPNKAYSSEVGEASFYCALGFGDFCRQAAHGRLILRSATWEKEPIDAETT